MTHDPTAAQVTLAPTVPARRSFFARLAGFAMFASLVASYGTFAVMAGRFLLPTHSRRKAWRRVAEIGSFQPATTRTVVAPSGERIVVARCAINGASTPATVTVDDFVALSSTCPHLGCQVTFEPQHQRFFCPCHNGTFAPDGRATGGPPFEAGQSLPRYPLDLRANLLYIEVPLDGVAG